MHESPPVHSLQTTNLCSRRGTVGLWVYIHQSGQQAITRGERPCTGNVSQRYNKACSSYGGCVRLKTSHHRLTLFLWLTYFLVSFTGRMTSCRLPSSVTSWSSLTHASVAVVCLVPGVWSGMLHTLGLVCLVMTNTCSVSITKWFSILYRTCPWCVTDFHPVYKLIASGTVEEVLYIRQTSQMVLAANVQILVT